MFSPENIRDDFPIIKTGELVYLDNAATTQKPSCVINSICEYYEKYNANVHRSNYSLAEKATENYERARKKIANFLGVEEERIIFTRGTTEAINLVAYSIFFGGLLQPGDKIAVTIAEHHSNFVPWQQLCKKFGVEMKIVDTTDEGYIPIESFTEAMDEGIKLLAFTGMSNSLGVVMPYHEVCKAARERGILTVLDGAQLVPHHRVKVDEIGCDFLAFSGHKILGPMGIGVLCGRRDILEKLPPFMYGGEMINKVTIEETSFNVLPYKFEAGTPNVEGAIGLAKAMEYVENIEWNDAVKHVMSLTKRLLEGLASIAFVEIYGPGDDRQHSIVSFNVKGLHPHDVAQYLSSRKIAIRSGHHCAQPQLRRLGIKASCRASLYIYNTKDDVDRLLRALEEIVTVFPWVMRNE